METLYPDLNSENILIDELLSKEPTWIPTEGFSRVRALTEPSFHGNTMEFHDYHGSVLFDVRDAVLELWPSRKNSVVKEVKSTFLLCI